MAESRGETFTARGRGAFFHYGPATYIGETPWIFDPNDIDASTFSPPGGVPDTDQWLAAATLLDIGYAVLTTKHHDGFALWPSKASAHHVSGGERADVVQAFVESCRRHDVAPVLYYAWHDRYHEGGDSFDLPDRDCHSPAYLRLVKDQLKELLTSYGEIAGIWLDVGPRTADRIADINDFIHEISPNTAFLPNIKPYEGSSSFDVGIYEDVLHGSFPNPVSEPTEWAVTVVQDGGDDWGWWQFSDLSCPTTSPEELALCLVRSEQERVAVNVNIPPGPNGRIPEGTVRLLERVRSLLRSEPGPRRFIHPLISRSDNKFVLSDGWSSDQQSIRESAHQGHQFGRARTFSDQIGASLELAYTGTLTSIFFAGGPDHGDADIEIDGSPVGRVDLWRSTPTGHLSWSPPSVGDAGGEHHLRIRVAGPNRPSRRRGNGTAVSVTGFVINPSE